MKLLSCWKQAVCAVGRGPAHTTFLSLQGQPPAELNGQDVVVEAVQSQPDAEGCYTRLPTSPPFDDSCTLPLQPRPSVRVIPSGLTSQPFSSPFMSLFNLSVSFQLHPRLKLRVEAASALSGGDLCRRHLKYCDIGLCGMTRTAQNAFCT